MNENAQDRMESDTCMCYLCGRRRPHSKIITMESPDHSTICTDCVDEAEREGEKVTP